MKRDDGNLEDNFTFAALCNSIHPEEGMKIASKALMDDSKLDLLYIKGASRGKRLQLFTKLGKGDHANGLLVNYIQTNNFELSTEETVPITLDGELI